MSAPCSGPQADVVKTVEVAKARKGSELQLECGPAFVTVNVLLTLIASASVTVWLS
jgi:hypothetical protein